MIYKKYFIFVNLLLFSFCLCEISEDKKQILLDGFKDYFNNLPNQIYTYDEGSLQNTQQVDETTYQIVANIEVTEIRNIDVTKSFKCTATIQDTNNEVTVTNNQCVNGQQSPAESVSQEQIPKAQVEVTEPTVERKPVKLENEVQSDTAITSGEQFIAIPRDQPSAPCVGCASHVNPQAAGVSDLASLGVRHLDIHEPSVKHSLNNVIDVERQVQVVNGVRYVLTLSIKFNKCVEEETDNCASSKTCKITILVKPWVKLPNGANYRAILGNNCTDEWIYGDNGEVLPEPSTDNHVHNDNTDDIQVKHNTDVQSQPNQERSLTDEELKNLQDQIIPNSQFQESTEVNREGFTVSPDASEYSKQHVFKAESTKHSENSIPVTNSEAGTQQTVNINSDKKKAIDEMLDFFDFSGIQPKTEVEEVIPRVRRSYDYDLQVLSVAEEFHGIKKSLQNARFMYEMAQVMVDYLNEMDMEVKNRAVKNVIKAEEEIENLQRFVYVQASVTIPCDKVECEPRDAVNQICNGVIDSTNEKNPQILNTFCYNDNNERDYRDVIKDISLDDPVLQKLVKEALKKIESESNTEYALKINKIVSATTQVTSGRLTKLSVILDSIKCNKSVPLALRVNCTVIEQLGSKICEIIIHERHWLKERKISYTCTDRPVDMRISKSKSIVKNITVDDPKIIEMLQEAIQYLETQSDKNNKQKIVNIKSISSQLIAGFLTKIEFVVGYTNCTDENYSRDESNKCELLNNEGLRLCKAQIWDRSWIMDGRQVEVSCDDVEKSNEIEKTRKKRSIDFVSGQLQQSVNNNLGYIKLADESLKKFLHSSSSRQHYKVVKVDRANTQDVHGKLTKIEFSISPTNCVIQANGLPSLSKCDVVNPKQIFRCRSKILERVWLDKTQYFVNCNTKDQEQETKTHSNGLKEHNPNDSKYYLLAEESLQKYLNDTGNSPNHKVVRVEKVTTQIVSGLLTSMDFIISNQNEHSSKISCHSNILEKHWLGTKQYNVSCKMQEKRNAYISMAQKPDNLKYMQIAVESLQKYLKYKPESHLVRVTFVDKVIKAGNITKIIFIASHAEDDDGDTICHAEFSEHDLFRSDIEVKCDLIGTVLRNTEIGKEDPTFSKYLKLADESLHKYLQTINDSELYTIMSIENVTVQWDEGIKTYINFIVSPIDMDNSDLKGLRCLSQIEEQPWLHKKHTEVNCEKDNKLYRMKRRVSHANIIKKLGGPTIQDPSKPEYKVLAEESLSKYVRDSATTTPLRVARVERVTTQVVSGSKTSIDFIVSSKENFFTCHSDIWEQRWLGKKEITVNCNINKENSRKKRELIQVHSNDKGQHDGSILRGQIEETQDPNKPEYIILAEESLRKYEKKSSIYHKVIEVKRVVTRVVSGFKYKIDFNASPTSCSANVTKLRARSCQPIDNIILYCHTEIWDRPWLKSKKIEVQCHGPDDNDFEEYGSDSDSMDTPSDLKRNNNQKYKLLAEEASEKYLTTSNRKYVHEVTEIHSVSEQIADGTITKIEYSLSPTTCLRNETRRSNDSCAVKTPLIVFHCNATIWDRPWLHIEKEIKVTCKKMSKPNKKSKRALGDRTVRQIGDDDDEIDEDITYYYADRAVQHVNDQSSSNNLHKLITIHAVQNSVQMGTMTIRMYIDIAETFCLRHHKEMNLNDCEEMDGLGHRLCLARLWPSPDDELVVRHVSVVCDDDQDFESITGLNIAGLLRLSIEDLERSPDAKYKLVHQGEPQVIPTLDSKLPFKINFIVATTNCSKDVNLDKNPFQCYINTAIPSRACHSFIWLKAETRFVRYINAKCTPPPRSKRSLSDPANLTLDNLEIQKLVTASLEKLEMSSMHRYKQRILQINSHSTRLSSGKVTTIDFDVGYTSCLKYEWVENITSCDFIEHLPRRRCVAQIWERLWINNGKNIDVNCVDDETPLESHIEFESAEMANELAKQALKHIEAKYPHPSKQKVVRIFSLEKQVVAGIHYRMKVEVGFTDCVALSEQTDCKLLKNVGSNKFCRINVWLRPWTDHPPNFRVSCDFQEGTTHDFYHQVQAEHLFYHFLTTYSPSYQNDYSQMQKRFEIFKNNIKRIHELNAHEKGTATYGVTRFADLTYEEFSSTYMGLKTNLSDANLVPMKKADIPDIKVPPNFDWREYDAVTEVKDQGSCGSCWAFSVTGNIEGQWKMQSGQLVSLSEQELVDCDKLDDGCNGGLPDNAYRAIEQMGGLELESDYPYEGVDEKCEFNKTMAKVQISSAVNITTNETGMAQWLVHNGPISIGINANAMQFYMGGISHPWKMLCNPGNLDHGVLIVGYGIKDYPLFHKQLPFWIVKNSWGKSWGEQGYYRVYRGDGTCGVNQMASSAII